MPRISPHVQEFTMEDGAVRCAGCGAQLINAAIEHSPGCEATCRGHHANALGEAADWDIDVELDLRELGLQHRPGSGCGCKGRAHPVSVGFDPEGHGFIHESDTAAWDAEVLQVLHEQAHPDGVLYAENCREPGCADAYA